MFDPSLYFVTHPIGDDLLVWRNLVFEAVLGGVTMVQVRDKTSSTRKIIEATQCIQPFLKEKKIPLLINDRADIASILRLDGVHLGQSDLTVPEARSFLGTQALIGISLEHPKQLHTVASADYVAASPVFPSRSKFTSSSWNLTELKKLREDTSLPLIAIGGINTCNLQTLLEIGVDGIAVISAIASAPNPRKAAEKLLHEIKNGS